MEFKRSFTWIILSTKPLLFYVLYKSVQKSIESTQNPNYSSYKAVWRIPKLIVKNVYC